MPFPVSGNPRQEFALGKLTNDGNNVAAYSSRYPCQQKRESKCSAFILSYCDIAVSRKREPSARICPWQIDERQQQRCRVLVTIPCQQKRESKMLSLFCWQGRRDSNTQPTVLETATLPLSHSPIKPVHFTIIQNESQEFLIVF